jgi:hypothetical protein
MRSVFIPLLTAAAAVCAAQTIQFSGYTWQVKDSGSNKWGPGPNLFSSSPSNVWVDSSGRLHMRIRKQGNRWYCSEVINTGSFGHGTYRFYLDSAVDNLDPNVVLGLFTWNDLPDYNHRELDIEFSRWSDPTDQNAQYVVQPYTIQENLYRFDQPASTPQSTHSLEWRAGMAVFLSIKGHFLVPPAPDSLIAQRTFTSGIPLPGGENARINLWLFRGRTPRDRQEVEVVIKKFEYAP